MPRGVYSTKNGSKVTHGQEWPDAIVDCARVEMANGASYAECFKTIRKRFPNFITTRNALIGKCNRMGISSSKKMANAESIAEVKKMRKQDRRLTPKTEKPVELLREDAGRLSVENKGALGMRRRTKEEIEIAKKGHIPAIVEAQPETSKPFSELRRGECKWPTAIDASMACGCPATVGAYCDKHALLAYKTMPTRKRQAVIDKEQDIDRVRRARIDADAENTIAHFLSVGVSGAPRITGEDAVDAFIAEHVIDD